jgi:hypothetical protein
MGRTACTEPQCPYKGALYLTRMEYVRCSDTSYCVFVIAIRLTIIRNQGQLNEDDV